MKFFLIFWLIFGTACPAMAADVSPFQAPKSTQPVPEARAFTGTYDPQRLHTGGKDTVRKPNVEIWLPPDFQKPEIKWPVLIFSHDFGGCARQSEFLTAYLADQGYIVIAPDHADARCAGRKTSLGRLSGLSISRGGAKDWPEKPFRSPDLWTDKTEADRKDDVLSALSYMLANRKYKDRIDPERMGLIGYGLGGHTVLGMAGGWPSWKDARFKAVVALSPYMGPFMKHKLWNIGIPVFYESGTLDKLAITDIKRNGGAYTQTPSPKYFIELDGADHSAWSADNRDYQGIIRRGVLAFADRYVRGKEDVVIDEEKKPKIKTFWKDEDKTGQKAAVKK